MKLVRRSRDAPAPPSDSLQGLALRPLAAKTRGGKRRQMAAAPELIRVETPAEIRKRRSRQRRRRRAAEEAMDADREARAAAEAERAARMQQQTPPTVAAMLDGHGGAVTLTVLQKEVGQARPDLYEWLTRDGGKLPVEKGVVPVEGLEEAVAAFEEKQRLERLDGEADQALDRALGLIAPAARAAVGLGRGRRRRGPASCPVGITPVVDDGPKLLLTCRTRFASRAFTPGARTTPLSWAAATATCAPSVVPHHAMLTNSSLNFSVARAGVVEPFMRSKTSARELGGYREAGGRRRALRGSRKPSPCSIPPSNLACPLAAAANPPLPAASLSSFGVGGSAARHTGRPIFRSIHCRRQISWNMWSQGVTMNSPVTALTGPMQMAHSGPSAPAALSMCAGSR